MFQRIIHEPWTAVIPALSFVILFLVFLGAAIRALIMPRGDRERLAALPLDDGTPRGEVGRE